jgi:hypothetical protein
MGTWNASILGNDTSAEVYDTFFHHWDRGATFEEIEAVIDDQFATSLGDVHLRSSDLSGLRPTFGEIRPTLTPERSERR